MDRDSIYEFNSDTEEPSIPIGTNKNTVLPDFQEYDGKTCNFQPGEFVWARKRVTSFGDLHKPLIDWLIGWLVG